MCWNTALLNKTMFGMPGMVWMLMVAGPALAETPARGAAIIDFDPETLMVVVPLGESDSRDLTLTNLGGGMLTWELLDQTVPFQRLDALPLQVGENQIRSEVIDPDGRFAYLGTNTFPGRVVKIDLNGFERVGAIELDGSEGSLHAAVIDPAGEFAYFGTSTFPGRVVKIDLNTFEWAGTITLHAGEDALHSAVIDPAGEFAYFGTWLPPGRVIKVDLNSFERVGAIELEAGESNFNSAVIDAAGEFAYFAAQLAESRVVKIDLEKFERVDSLLLEAADSGVRTAVIDAAGEFAYFGTNSFPGRVVKVDLAAFERVAAITLEEEEDLLASAVMDPSGEYAYFGTDTAPGRVVKIDLERFERVGMAQLATGENFPQSALIDTQGRYAYYTLFNSPAVVTRIDLGRDCALPEWLGLDPQQGSLDGGDQQQLEVAFDSGGVPVGSHSAHLCLSSNDAARPLVEVPVTLEVELPADFAVIEGTVDSAGRCGRMPAPLAGATVEINGAGGAAEALLTDQSGGFRTFLPDSESPLGMQVSASGHLPDAAADIAFSAGDVVVQDFALALQAPCAAVMPGSLALELASGVTGAMEIEIGNIDGVTGLEWAVVSDEVAMAPGLLAFDGHFDIGHWTLVNTPEDVGGSVRSEPGPPLELYVEGGNDNVAGHTDFQIEIPFDGEIHFDWGYQSLDDEDWDSGGYAVNGEYTVLAINANPVPFFSASATVGVAAGDVFAFRVATQDGFGNPGILGVSGFEFNAEICAGDGTPAGWLSVSPGSGVTAGGAADTVSVAVDTAGLAPGVYRAFLCIATNDAHAGLTGGLIPVPVELRVTDSGPDDELFSDRFEVQP